MPAPSFLSAVGFDLGETLLTYRDTPLSWAGLYRPVLRVVAETCGVTAAESDYISAEAILSRHNTRLYPRSVEIPAEEILGEVLQGWCGEPGGKAQIDRAVRAFFGFFQQRIVAYEDSRATLLRLREGGLRLGLLTDVPYGMPREYVDEDLAKVGLTGLLDVVLTSVEVGFRKPDPSGFFRLANELGVTPARMVYVGNEPKDIAGAKAAGARAILIDREGLWPDLGQDKTILALGELASDELLLELRNKSGPARAHPRA